MNCPPCPHCLARLGGVRALDTHLRFECPVLRPSLDEEAMSMVQLIDFGVSPNGRIMFSLECDGGSGTPGEGGERVDVPSPVVPTGGGRRRRMRRAALALVAATVAIAGCGGSTAHKAPTVAAAQRQLSDLQQAQRSIEDRLHAVPARADWGQLPAVCAALAPEEATLAGGVTAVVWPAAARDAADRLHTAATATASRLTDCANTVGSPRSLAAASGWANATGDAAANVAVRLSEVAATV